MFQNFKKTSVLMMVLLTPVTFGIYPWFWFSDRFVALLNLESGEKMNTSPWFASSMFVLSILHPVLRVIRHKFERETLVLELFVSLFLVVGWILLAFDYRRVLLRHTTSSKVAIVLSRLLTFLFGPLYLQYKINRLKAGIASA
jgi:hypothetical protein